MTVKKTPAKQRGSKRAPPKKVRQPHGGALYSGGVPGHDGSRAGRRRDEVRQMLLNGASQAVPILIEQLNGSDPLLAQNAADKLLRYGIGPQRDATVAVDEVRERVKRTIEIIRRTAPMDLAEEILHQLQKEWA